MNSSILLFGILPLLVFVIVDSFFPLKRALMAAFVVGILELAATIYYLGEVDLVSIFFFSFFAASLFMAYKMNNPLYVKIAPAFISLFLGLFLIGSFLMDKPLFVIISEKYKFIYPVEFQQQILSRSFQIILKYLTLNSGIAMLFHGALVAIAALKWNKWIWIFIKGIGIYLFFILAALATNMMNL